MVRATYRLLKNSAALALVSWALAAGAPALAAATADRAGPQLPTAKYKALPVGTIVTYDTWGYTVTTSDGYNIRFKTDAGNWKKYYAVFGKHGSNVYLSGEWGSAGQDWESDLDAESKAALETMWPLKVGKKVKLNSEESRAGYSGFPSTRPWTVALEVVRTEILKLNGVLYSTYVIEEHAVSEGSTGAYAPSGPKGYSETKWYDPESGLVLKSVKEITRGREKGDRKEYSLVRVRFPQGTKTNVLAGTTAAPPPAARRRPASRDPARGQAACPGARRHGRAHGEETAPHGQGRPGARARRRCFPAAGRVQAPAGGHQGYLRHLELHRHENRRFRHHVQNQQWGLET